MTRIIALTLLLFCVQQAMAGDRPPASVLLSDAQSLVVAGRDMQSIRGTGACMPRMRELQSQFRILRERMDAAWSDRVQEIATNDADDGVNEYADLTQLAVPVNLCVSCMDTAMGYCSQAQEVINGIGK